MKEIDSYHTYAIFLAEYGPPLIEHVLLKQGFGNSTKIGKTFDVSADVDKLMQAILEADKIFKIAQTEPQKVCNSTLIFYVNISETLFL